MSYIPNCREDEDYNEKYLSGRKADFIKGYDYAVEIVKNLFDGNLNVYPEVEDLLDDKKAIIQDGKAEMVINAINHWLELQRNEVITGMIDGMSEDEYLSNKEKVYNEG